MSKFRVSQCISNAFEIVALDQTRHDLSKQNYVGLHAVLLTDWGRMTHICVGNLTIIGSDNGLSPGRHQAIIWTNAEKSLIRPQEQTSVKS